MDIESRNATDRQTHATHNQKWPSCFPTKIRDGNVIGGRPLYPTYPTFFENHRCESDDMKFNLVVFFYSFQFVVAGFCADGVTTDVDGRTACDDMFTRPTIPYYVGFFSFLSTCC